MSRAVDCGACASGDHTGHVRDWNVRPELIGGEYCPCGGDCAERAKAAWEASPFAQALAPTVPVAPTSVEFDGLLHQCNDPDCHVPGFVSTLTRLAPTHPATADKGEHAAGEEES